MSLKALRRFRWRDVPRGRRRLIWAVGTVTSVTAVLEYKFRECIAIVGNPAGITQPHTLFWVRLLFGRARSRWFGSLAETNVPVAIRDPLFRSIAWKYGIDLDEVRYPLDSFRTVSDFFCRTLREGTRPVESVATGLVSPVDADVVSMGTVKEPGARLEQVKGATYSVPSFLGLDPVELLSPGTEVHYVVLYLAPNYYHRIHSPCQLKISQGRHFCGELLPLRESMLRRMADVLSVNERVVLSGEWRFGAMHLVAVGAYNVGSIFLDFDEKLKTNRMRDICVHCGGDVSSKLYPKGVSLAQGDPVGGFRLGSTVVLFFEGPSNFRWAKQVGDKVLMGQTLGRVE